MITMRELIWIACIMLVAEAAFHHCEISFPDEPPQEQGQKGEKGEPTKTCNCSALTEIQEQLSKNEENLSKTEDELNKTKEELSQTSERLSKTEQQLSDLKQKPRDCYDVIYYNPNSTSGVYTIFPANYRPEGIEVLCDMDTDGGGWIVFQTRKDGSVDFYRGWKDYLLGFGNLTGEFWLGLEYIHQLTKYGTYDLRIDMTDFEKHEAYAAYNSFSIGEGPGYILNAGEYFGDAGESLEVHRNHKFSTKDQDQDSASGSCSQSYLGAWWYEHCHQSNLNGQYLGGVTDVYGKGVVWKFWKEQYYSLKSTEMKSRPNFASYV